MLCLQDKLKHLHFPEKKIERIWSLKEIRTDKGTQNNDSVFQNKSNIKKIQYLNLIESMLSVFKMPVCKENHQFIHT